MANPYGIDYLKNLVSESLNEKGEDKSPYGLDSEEPETEDNGGNNAMAGYGIPAHSAPTAQVAQAPAGASMGPRFQALAQNAGLGPAARLMAPAAVYGGSSIVPGAPAMMQGAQEWAKPSGKRKDFTDSDPPKNIHEYLNRLSTFESGNNPLAYNKASSASGSFQYTDPTWGEYSGYKSAKDAPPEVQYQRAMEDTVSRLKHHGGDAVKATLTHFLGAKGLEKVLANPQKLYEPVNKENGDTTPFSYAAGILGKKAVQDWAMGHHTTMGQQSSASKELYNLPAQG